MNTNSIKKSIYSGFAVFTVTCLLLSVDCAGGEASACSTNWIAGEVEKAEAFTSESEVKRYSGATKYHREVGGDEIDPFFVFSYFSADYQYSQLDNRTDLNDIYDCAGNIIHSNLSSEALTNVLATEFQGNYISGNGGLYQ